MNNKPVPQACCIALVVIILLISGTSAAASSPDDEDSLTITVIIPSEPEPPPPLRVFPINVAEGYNYEGRREIIRVYELRYPETPELINTASFERNGYYFRMAEIIRRFDVNHTVREHTEVLEVQTSTNDLASAIARLEPYIEFTCDDGYTGLLFLDITSIDMTQDGTRRTTHTARQTRHYPHLSAPDISLVPQTVTAGGNTYTLSNVEWQATTSSPVDFTTVANTFTAIATYSRTATGSVSIGYTTQATYAGTLTRVSTGQTRYVVNFFGTLLDAPEQAEDKKGYFQAQTNDAEGADEAARSNYPVDDIEIPLKQVQGETIETPAGVIGVGWFVFVIILLLFAILVILLLVSGRSKQMHGAIMMLGTVMSDKFRRVFKNKKTQREEIVEEREEQNG